MYYFVINHFGDEMIIMRASSAVVRGSNRNTDCARFDIADANLTWR